MGTLWARLVRYLCVISICFGTVGSPAAFAQLQTKHWYFGDRSGLVFDGDDVSVLQDGAMETGENCSVVSHPQTGELLLYTNGEKVWDADHRIVLFSGNLLGSTTVSRGALLLPEPEGDYDKFYLYTAGPTTNGRGNADPRLAVTVIEKLTSQGEWLVTEKNAVLQDSVGEQVAATLTCDGEGYWLVAHHLRLNLFYIYKLDANLQHKQIFAEQRIGFQAPPQAVTEERDKWTFYRGYLQFSPNGKLLCQAVSRGRFVQLYRFNNSTGELSSPIIIDLPNTEVPYGCAFSVDSRKLYVTLDRENPDVLQFDLTVLNETAVNNSKYKIETRREPGARFLMRAISLAPNDKLYLTDGSPNLDVINNPSLSGAACDFEENVLYIGRPNWASLPDFVSNWHAKPQNIGLTCVRPTIRLDAETELCAGQYLIVDNRTYGNPRSQVWEFEGGLPRRFAGPVPPPILYAEPGRYRIKMTAENEFGSSTETIVITVHPKPEVNLGPDVEVCPGQRVTLQAGGAVTYEWRIDPGIEDVNSSQQSFIPNGSAEYVVCGKNDFGCENCDTVLVTVSDEFKVDAGPDHAICLGESVQLTGTGSGEIEWSPAAGLDDVNSLSPLAQPQKTTLYRLTISSGECVDSDEVLVEVLERPELVTGPDRTICPGEQTVISASGAKRYEWSPAEGLDKVNTAAPLARPAQSTRYKVLGFNDFGCVDSAFVNVEVVNELALRIQGPTAACRDERIQLQVEGASEYEWSPAELFDDPSSANPILTLQKTTLIRVVGRSGTCEASTEFELRVLPPVELELAAAQKICRGESTVLQASGADRYEWSPARGLDDVNSPAPTASPMQTTRYRVLGFNDFGCVDSAFVTVEVVSDLDLQVTAPAAVCRGTTVQLQARGAETYEWSPAELFDDPRSAAPSLVADRDRSVQLIGRRGACEAVATVDVRVLTPPNVSVRPVAPICTGESVQLSAVGAGEYSWEPAEGLDDANSANPIAAPGATTQYRVLGRDENGCESEGVVVVEVRPRVELRFALELQDAPPPAEPGDERIVTVLLGDSARGSQDLDLRELTLEFALPLNGLGLRRGITQAQAGWNWTVESSVAENRMTLQGSGNAALRSGRLFNMPFTVYQYNYESLIADVELVETSIEENACRSLRLDRTGIPLSAVCMASARNLGVSGGRFALQAPTPNPARGGFEISFSTGFDTNTSLDLFNTLGRRVVEIENTWLPAGDHMRHVNNLAPGVYLLVMRAGPFSATQEILLFE